MNAYIIDNFTEDSFEWVYNYLDKSTDKKHDFYFMKVLTYYNFNYIIPIEYDTIRVQIERHGQDKFRRELMKRFNRTCVITGSTIEDNLDACHIIPYSICGHNDIRNGILLTSSLHKLFDKCSYFTIVYDGTVIINDKYKDDPTFVNIKRHVKIPPYLKESLQWHNNQYYDCIKEN
jgi:predicted restriction endonuclease